MANWLLNDGHPTFLRNRSLFPCFSSRKMPICSQTVNRERRQLFDTSILIVENHVNKRLAGEIFGRDVPYEQRGFGTPDGRTKIMELPSIGERLHYTWRSYSVTLYRMHACACTSLPRMRTISTSGLRDHTNLISFIICYLVTLSRVERVRVSVFFFILYDSKTRASLFQTLLDFYWIENSSRYKLG